MLLVGKHRIETIPAKGGANVESSETTALRKISLKLRRAVSGEQ